MTNDDLTPEEREALSSLPRERTPSAGLEDRVVAAMREHGHIRRKPARVIPITATRVAGLLAACVALMIGAYSIGLHNRIDNEVLKNVQPESRQVTDEGTRREQEIGMKPPQTLGNVGSQAESPVITPEAGFVDKQAPEFKPALNVPKIATSKDEKKKDTPARTDEVRESMSKSFTDRLSETESAAPASASRSAAQMQVQSNIVEQPTSDQRSREFALSGGTLIVDAPDSVRVVQDAEGKTLLIYTSDGIIRIRLTH